MREEPSTRVEPQTRVSMERDWSSPEAWVTTVSVAPAPREVMRAVPATSNLYWGSVVPIPTLVLVS